jgi:hypothetical protein
MARAGISEVQLRNILARKDGVLELLVEAQRLLGRGGQRLQLAGLQARHELGVAEGFVVAEVSEELRSVVQVGVELLLRQPGFFGERIVVAFAVLVQGNDEIVDGLGLGRELAEDDTRAGEAGSVTMLAYMLWSVRVAYSEMWCA